MENRTSQTALVTLSSLTFIFLLGFGSSQSITGQADISTAVAGTLTAVADRTAVAATVAAVLGPTPTLLEPTPGGSREPMPVPRVATPVGVLYSEHFTDVQSGWPSGTFDHYTYGYQAPHFYAVGIDSSALEFVAPVPGKIFDNLSVETDVFVDTPRDPKGDFRYGLAIRRQGRSYYAFAISPFTKSWYVLKYSPEGRQVLATGRDGSIGGLRGPDGKDHLRVDAYLADLVFYVNNVPVVQVRDPSYLYGETALYVETMDQPLARVLFDSVLVRAAAPTGLVTTLVAPQMAAQTPIGTPLLASSPVPLATPTLTPARVPSATPTLARNWFSAFNVNKLNKSQAQIDVDYFYNGEWGSDKIMVGVLGMSDTGRVFEVASNSQAIAPGTGHATVVLAGQEGEYHISRVEVCIYHQDSSVPQSYCQEYPFAGTFVVPTRRP